MNPKNRKTWSPTLAGLRFQQRAGGAQTTGRRLMNITECRGDGNRGLQGSHGQGSEPDP